MPEDYFQEHTHYYVDRKALGEGSFGHVYRVYLRSDRSKKVVVKEVKLFPCWFHWWCSDAESKFWIYS